MRKNIYTVPGHVVSIERARTFGNILVVLDFFENRHSEMIFCRSDWSVHPLSLSCQYLLRTLPISKKLHCRDIIIPQTNTPKPQKIVGMV
jgi:hypothetical protein